MASTYSPQSELPPQARKRSLADMETRIAATEARRAQWFQTVEALTAAGRLCRREQSMLRLAEQKLVLLRRSQTVLTAGELAKR